MKTLPESKKKKLQTDSGSRNFLGKNCSLKLKATLKTLYFYSSVLPSSSSSSFKESIWEASVAQSIQVVASG